VSVLFGGGNPDSLFILSSVRKSFFFVAAAHLFCFLLSCFVQVRCAFLSFLSRRACFLVLPPLSFFWASRMMESPVFLIAFFSTQRFYLETSLPAFLSNVKSFFLAAAPVFLPPLLPALRPRPLSRPTLAPFFFPFPRLFASKCS